MFRPIKISGAVAGLMLCFVFSAAAWADTTTPIAPPADNSTAQSSDSTGGKMPPTAAPPAAAVIPPKTPPFPDVPVTHPAAAAVASLKSKNIMGGRADGKFHGTEYVTRYELAVILDRFVTYTENQHKPLKETKVPGPYTVSAPQSHWAHKAQIHLVSNGILPKDSPILKAPGAARVTKDQLSEALAETMIAISDRSLAPQRDDMTNPQPGPKPPTN